MGYAPFSTTSALSFIQDIINSHPWYTDHDMTKCLVMDENDKHNLDERYTTELIQTLNMAINSKKQSSPDKRFNTIHWNAPFYNFLSKVYLLNSRYLREVVKSLTIKDIFNARRLDFLINQTVSACSPSNFLLTNPDALRTMFSTGQQSIQLGLINIQRDLIEGKLQHSDVNDYTVGKNLATTKGAVVYENEYFQLIQFSPLTETQYQRPILIVPPLINKYYILDLSPENSMVRHLLMKGFQVFLISWNKFEEHHSHYTWDDFLKYGIIKAINVSRAVSKEKRLNCLGFCIGGTMLSCALAVLAKRGDNYFSSLTLLATYLDCIDAGDTGLFIDEDFVKNKEYQIGGGNGQTKLFHGKTLSNFFSLLRPDELWWNYYVEKYLKGMKPNKFEVLYWNNDSTDLPGPLYCWFLRNIYLDNKIQNKELYCCDEKIDISDIDYPVYLVGAKEDHIVPWHNTYSSKSLFKKNCCFVLTSSGHIAGIVNPPGSKRRYYWKNEFFHDDAQSWFDSAKKHDGSWWVDWFDWLSNKSGKHKIATIHQGSNQYPFIENAPGRYVLKGVYPSRE